MRKQVLPIAYFMANFAGAFCCGMRHGRVRVKNHPNRTSRKRISPIAYFMANSVADSRFRLNCRPSAWSLTVKFGS